MLKTQTTVVAAIFGMALLYVLSYAPVYRWSFGPDKGGTPWRHLERERWQSAYTPVEWLIDSTRLRKPLIRWAQVWDVGSMSADWVFRMVQSRDMQISSSTPPLTPAVRLGSTVAMLFCVVVFFRYCLPVLRQ